MASNNPRGNKINPRYKNGTLRRKYRARLKAQGGPCGICQGRLGEIHYDEPSDWKHPLSFVVDEIIPVSRWKEYGYSSPAAAAQDWNNLQPAHYCCNQAKSNKIINKTVNLTEAGRKSDVKRQYSEKKQKNSYRTEQIGQIISKINISDGHW